MDKIICGKCGKIHEKCNGHRRKVRDSEGNPIPCGKNPMENGCCELHGGLTPKGELSPNFKNGKYSKYLPDLHRDKYDAIAANRANVSLKNEIDLYDYFIEQRMEDVLQGRTGEAWNKLIDLQKLYRIALKLHNHGEIPDDEYFPDVIYESKEEEEAEKAKKKRKSKREESYEKLIEIQFIKARLKQYDNDPDKILDEIQKTLQDGLVLYNADKYIEKLVEMKAHLVKTNSKSMKDVSTVITNERANLMIDRIADIINRNVSSRTERAAIFAEFRAESLG